MYLNPPREMVELNPLPLIEQHPELFVSHDFCSAATPDVWVTLNTDEKHLLKCKTLGAYTCILS